MPRTIHDEDPEYPHDERDPTTRANGTDRELGDRDDDAEDRDDLDDFDELGERDIYVDLEDDDAAGEGPDA